MCFFVSILAHGIEGEIFNLRGENSIEIVLEKLGAPKNSKLPVNLKIKGGEITVDMQVSNKDKIISIDFNTPFAFQPSDKDLFEVIELKNAGDLVNYNLIVSAPKTGRIWRLTNELKVYRFELTQPWSSTAKLQSLKDILKGQGHNKLQKSLKKKVEVSK